MLRGKVSLLVEVSLTGQDENELESAKDQAIDAIESLGYTVAGVDEDDFSDDEDEEDGEIEWDEDLESLDEDMDDDEEEDF